MIGKNDKNHIKSIAILLIISIVLINIVFIKTENVKKYSYILLICNFIYLFYIFKNNIFKYISYNRVFEKIFNSIEKCDDKYIVSKNICDILKEELDLKRIALIDVGYKKDKFIDGYVKYENVDKNYKSIREFLNKENICIENIFPEVLDIIKPFQIIDSKTFKIDNKKEVFFKGFKLERFILLPYFCKKRWIGYLCFDVDYNFKIDSEINNLFKKIMYVLQNLYSEDYYDEHNEEFLLNYNMLNENSSEALFILNKKDLVIIYCNKKAREISDFDKDGFINKDFLKVFENKFDDYTKNIFINNISQNIKCDIHLEININDEVRIMRLTADNIFYRDREIVKVKVVDMTDVYNARKMVCEREQKLKKILEFIPLCIIETDMSFKIKYGNKEFYKQYKVSEEDDLTQFFRGTSKDRFFSTIDKLKEGKLENSIFSEYEIKNSTGEKRELLLTLSLIKELDELKGFRAAFIDITPLKEIERQNIKNLAAIEQSNLQIIIFDDKFKVEYANPSMLNAFCISLDQIKTKTFDFFINNDKVKIIDIVNDLERGKSWSGKSHNIASTGRKFISKYNISPVKYSEYEKVNYLLFAEDITEKVIMEKKLIDAMEKAKSASIAKSYFLANMSHEIRTPLNGIIGLTELLNETPLNIEQKGYLKDILTSGRHLMHIVNNILDFSKIEKGEMKLNLVEFKFKTFIDEIMRSFEGSFDHDNVKLIYTVDNKIPKIIRGDKIRLKQILMNLLNNAVKFTEEGVISLEVELKEMFNEHIIIDFNISDTGIGISKEKIKHIFDDFMQVDDSPSRQYGGTGLGLAIVKKLVNLMGGELTVTSKLGAGSTFNFVVFLKSAKENEEIEMTREDELQVLKEDIKVLIAEDNVINQRFFANMFRKKGYIVNVVDNGKKVLDILKYEEFDCVLMDIHMPVMNGIDTVIEIRKKELGKKNKLPVIAITADAISDDVENFKIAGFDDVVTKPFKFRDLQKKMLSLIGSRKDQENKEIDIKEAGEEYNYISIEKIKDFFEGAPIDSLINMLDNLISKKDSIIEDIKKRVISKDIDNIREICHKTIGVVAFYHSDKINNSLINIKENAKNNDIEKVKVHFKEFEKMFPEFLEELKRLKVYLKKIED